MEISEIKIGMLLDMCCQGDMNYIEKARVEATAHDCFVVRDDAGAVWLIDYGVWDLWVEDKER